MKNLATPSSIFISSSSTGELCSQPIRDNVRRIGRMFPEHVERSFLDPEHSFDEYFQLGSRRKVRPIKNGLYTRTPSTAWFTTSFLLGGRSRKVTLGAWSLQTLPENVAMVHWNWPRSEPVDIVIIEIWFFLARMLRPMLRRTCVQNTAFTDIYHVSAQGVDESTIHVHYYYYF